VLSVWCKPNGQFTQTKLHSKLQPLVKEIKKNKNDYLYLPIKTIYNIFKNDLSAVDIKKIEKGFKANNAIKQLCAGKLTPLLYKDIKVINRGLAKEIKSFFNDLYNCVFRLQSFKDLFGDIHEHYNDFVIKNNNGFCPFCGITDLTSENLDYDDAYDHFLAKGKYPFSSVNFKNLFPMCHDCNSYNKHVKDVIQKNGTTTRRQSFYPYTSYVTDLNIEITLKTKVYSKLKFTDVDLEISSNNHPEETQTWSEVFNLETRYKDQCVKGNKGKQWIKNVFNECVNYGFTPKELFKLKVKVKSLSPLNEQNFIEVPLLKAADKIGMF
jgi:hypothetical protein